MLIAVSSFGESLRRERLTAPAEACFNRFFLKTRAEVKSVLTFVRVV